LVCTGSDPRCLRAASRCRTWAVLFALAVRGSADVAQAQDNAWRVERIAWFDCETTGTDPERDLLLEVALIVTDGELRSTARESVVIHHEKDALDAAMWGQDRPWETSRFVSDMHAKNGLWSDLQRNHRTGSPGLRITGPNETMADAERLLIATLAQGGVAVAGPSRTVLGGCSPWLDRYMLRRNMPTLYSMLSHRTIDSSSLKMALVTWGDQEIHKARESTHRAADDVVDAVRLAARARSFIRQGSRLIGRELDTSDEAVCLGSLAV